VHVMMVIDYAAQRNYSLPIRVAALMHDLGKGTTPPAEWPSHHGHEARSVSLVDVVSQRLKIPNECRDLAVMVAREHGNVTRAMEMRANTLVSLMERCDAFRKPQRFFDMLSASECDHRGRTGFSDIPFPQAAYMERTLAAAQAVDAGAVAQKLLGQPQKIAEAVHNARIAAVNQVIQP
jgi:tRNA nucleotidyltransferase (CCA-adding enzyme)